MVCCGRRAGRGGVPSLLPPLLVITLLATHAVSFSPQFTAPVANVTVARGRDAKFTCLVRHLGGYRVGWVKADTKAIQAIHTHVITHNPRVHVNFDDHSTWHLIIKQVTEDDKGPYMCQINTDPMISQMGYLEVLKPPEIEDSESSGDVVATEGEMASLKCVASGHPTPSITWIREDSATIMVTDGRTTTPRDSWQGEVLELPQVSRDDMGAYLCIARNKVPPQVSKRILLLVHFHPIIHVPNQLIGAPYGIDVTLECKVEASPKPVTFWQNSQSEMLMSSTKYNVSDNHSKPGGYSVHMTLTIRNLTAPDIGHYTCVAKNSIGEVDSTINVYYVPLPTTTAPPRIPSYIETNRVEENPPSPYPPFPPAPPLPTQNQAGGGGVGWGEGGQTGPPPGPPYLTTKEENGIRRMLEGDGTSSSSSSSSSPSSSNSLFGVFSAAPPTLSLPRLGVLALLSALSLSSSFVSSFLSLP